MPLNKNHFYILFFVFFFFGNIFAQEENDGVIIKPTIGIGAGMLTYYGDISKNQKENSSIVSRVGFDIRVTQKINSYLDLNFNALFGKIGANEKSLTRNLNFESKITAGGVNLSYNFSNFLSEERIAEPYISLGLESFEFLSKTDLVDANGNPYFYWDDGSIRNLAQNDVNAENAIRLQRDFKYESDIRTLNKDNFGKYPERSFAFPVGAGVNIRVWDRCSFRLGTTMHFTFTDYLEGVTSKSVGNRVGDSRNDKFLFTSFALSYNLSSKEDEEEIPEEDAADLLALGNADSDGDGTKDMNDKCAGTPAGVPVDPATGCPLDDDKDGVPNYLDLELLTGAGLPVDSSGVAIPDSLLEAYFSRFGAGAEGEGFDTLTKKHFGEKQAGLVSKRYYVKVGEYSGDIPEDVANMILSIPDAQTWQEGNRTVITVGDYDKLPDAVKRALQLAEEGVKDAAVVSKNKKGNLEKVDSKGINPVMGSINDTPGELVYRVQIGAFSKNLSKNIFDGITDLVSVPGEDGLTRYYSGSFKEYKGAAGRKIDLITEGFEGAFVVGFKDGKKIPLKDGKPMGENNNKKSKAKDEKEAAVENKQGVVKKDYIKFRVQVGAYKKEVPSEVLAQYADLGNVEQKASPEGVTLYTSGIFSDFESAKKHREKLAEKGIPGAFVVGEFKGKILTAQEAIELLKK